MTLPELEKIRDALIDALFNEAAHTDDALEIVLREIHQMEQDQLLSESKASPT